MKYTNIFLILTFILLKSIDLNGQKSCYERINEEASRIDSFEVSTGTGFLVNNDGYIVTNRHVIERSKSLAVNFLVNGKKIVRSAEIICWDKTTDLALLKANIKDLFKEPFSFTFNKKEMKLGDKVYTLGFPTPDRLGESIKLTDGLISATSGYNDSKELYQISAPIQPGNSGSPLFDETGNVRGVIVSSYTNGQNVNYAIKGEYLFDILKWKNVIINTNTKTNSIKQNLRNIETRVCLIENIATKDFYEEFKFESNKIYSINESMFSMQDCTDQDLKAFFNPDNTRTYRDAEIYKIEHEDWIIKMFKNNYAQALYYSYKTNQSWDGGNALNKFSLLYKIGAYENIIHEHNLKFSFQSDKIDEGWFGFYVHSFLNYYVCSILMKYEKYNIKQLERLDSYLSFLIEINKRLPYTKWHTVDNKKENSANILVSKAYVMQSLEDKYKPNEICLTISEAKKIYPEVKIWYDNDCK